MPSYFPCNTATATARSFSYISSEAKRLRTRQIDELFFPFSSITFADQREKERAEYTTSREIDRVLGTTTMRSGRVGERGKTSDTLV